MTEGAELGTLPYSTPAEVTEFQKEYMHTHSYSGVLKNKLGIKTHINNGLSGSCNRRIARITISDIEKLLNNYAADEIFVIIGFTSIDRFEFYDTNYFKQVVPASVKILGKDFKVSNSRSLKYINDKVDAECEFISSLLTTHFLEILLLKNYLESKGVKYLFSYGLIRNILSEYPDEIDSVINNAELNILFNLIEYSNKLKWIHDVVSPLNLEEFIHSCQDSCFYEYLEKRKMNPGGGRHPTEKGHEIWANHIYEHIARYKIL